MMIHTNTNIKKLLAIDLDGTLLNDSVEISKGNLESLKKAAKNNITIAIVTGRELFSALSILSIIEKNDFYYYLICYNGALIIDLKSNEEIFLQNMSNKDVQRIVDFCIKEKLPIHIFGETYWGVTGINQSVENYMKLYDVETNIVNDASEIKDIDVINLVAVEEVDRVGQFIVENNINASFTYSTPNTVDIMDKSVTKGNGLKMLAEKLNFDKTEIISIGNYYNDIDMFKVSDIGIAIQNSPDEVKQYADYVTKNSNNDDGVKEAIEKFILS